MGFEQAQGREVIHQRPACIDRLPKRRAAASMEEWR